MSAGLRDLLPAVAALAEPRRDVNLRDVGALVGLSPSRAHRVFSAALDQSPKAYQRRTRLEHGALLLASTDAPVIDVALAAGYDSHEGFTRAFRNHFGQSPSQWRRRRRSVLTARQAGVAQSTSRCVGLYHRQLTRRKPAMTYDITVRTLEPVTFAHQTRRVDREQLGEVLAEVLPEVFGWVMQHGLAPAGHPVVRYLDASSAFVSIEAGMPLAQPPTQTPDAETGIVVGELPGGPAVVTVHQGPYELLGDAYAALERWLDEHDESPAGPPWEHYLTDPGEVPDPADWRTEVCWPIERNGAGRPPH